MNLANRLKKIRISQKMDRVTLAKGILSYSHLSNIELGRYEPSEEMLIALAKRLKVDEGYLLKYKEKDSQFEELLILLKALVDTNDLNQAESIIKNIIKDYPVIFSIYQETFFYLLISYFKYKSNRVNDALKLFELEVLPLLENINVEGLSSDFREVYYYIHGVNYFFKSDFYHSYQYFLRQMNLVKTNLLKAIVNYNVALTLYKLNNYHSAIKYAINALDLYLHERQWNKAADADNLLGALYLENQDLTNAEKHFLNAMEISNQYQLEDLKSRILHNLGLIYIWKKDVNKSLEYFHMSLELKKKFNKKNSLLATYCSIIDIYIEKELFDLTNVLLGEAKSMCDELDQQYHLQIREAKLNLKSQKNKEYELLMNDSIDFFINNLQWKQVIEPAEELGDYYYNNKKYKAASMLYKVALKAKNNNINQGGEDEEN